MKLFALNGWKGSGKDTVAGFLIDSCRATRVSFADPLKDSVSEEYGVQRTSLDDQALKESPILSLPIDPKDSFTKMICEFMYKEFVFSDSKKPVGFAYEEDKFYGDHPNGGRFQLFHCPRSLAILKGSTNRVVRSDFWVQKAIESIKDDYSSLIFSPCSLDPTYVISDLRYKSEAGQLREAFGEDLVTVRINRFETSPSSDPSEHDLDDYDFDYCIENKTTISDAFWQMSEIVKKSYQK